VGDTNFHLKGHIVGSRQIFQRTIVSGFLVMLVGMVGCASQPESVVQGPLYVQPANTPDYVERANTGSLFQPNTPAAFLFTGQKQPSRVGDTLKVEIAETLSASTKVSSDISRENKMAVKGPGNGHGGSAGGMLKSLLNLDASANGSDSFKGKGDTDNTSNFTGKIAVSVINVLGNGYLVVAGQRTVAFNRGNMTLRFSGVVNPADIRSGNVVASSDVVNANMESIGEGESSDSASRTWLQRVLTKNLTVW
jgi:flagellar L-ring protein precursor FlgH